MVEKGLKSSQCTNHHLTVTYQVPRFLLSGFKVLYKSAFYARQQVLLSAYNRAVSATDDQSSKRTVADRHRLAAHHNKHCWRAFLVYQHRWPWTPQNMFLVNFSLFQAVMTLKSEFFAEITGDRPRQPAYEIKLMLSRVSWALAHIYCNFSFSTMYPCYEHFCAYET